MWVNNFAIGKTNFWRHKIIDMQEQGNIVHNEPSQRNLLENEVHVIFFQIGSLYFAVKTLVILGFFFFPYICYSSCFFLLSFTLMSITCST